MIVTVDVLFSSSPKIGARIISGGTAHLAPEVNQAPSHVALLVNGRWVHESTGKTGVQVLSYPQWLQMHREVARIPQPAREYQEIADQYRKIKGKKYDYLGIVFFALALIPSFLAYHLFGAKDFMLPKVNMFQNPNKYFCCEALGYLLGKCYSMHAPVQVLSELLRG
jgi:hypothetical protein